MLQNMAKTKTASDQNKYKERQGEMLLLRRKRRGKSFSVSWRVQQERRMSTVLQSKGKIQAGRSRSNLCQSCNRRSKLIRKNTLKTLINPYLLKNDLKVFELATSLDLAGRRFQAWTTLLDQKYLRASTRLY